MPEPPEILGYRVIFKSATAKLERSFCVSVANDPSRGHLVSGDQLSVDHQPVVVHQTGNARNQVYGGLVGIKHVQFALVDNSGGCDPVEKTVLPVFGDDEHVLAVVQFTGNLG